MPQSSRAQVTRRRCAWRDAAVLAGARVTGDAPTPATNVKPGSSGGFDQGDADGAVTPENLADVTQQWKGAVGITGAGTTKDREQRHEHAAGLEQQRGHLGPVLLREVLRARS